MRTDQTNKTNKFNGGFTLIEILIVMVIIGILATLSIGSFQSSQQKARDAQRKSSLSQIANSLEAYYNDKKTYPDSSATNTILGCANTTECDWGEPFIDENGTSYMIELPADPKSIYNFYYISDGTYYQLYARLENTLDGDVPTLLDEPANYGISCGAENCNFGISSSNYTVTADRTITAE